MLPKCFAFRVRKIIPDQRIKKRFMESSQKIYTKVPCMSRTLGFSVLRAMCELPSTCRTLRKQLVSECRVVHSGGPVHAPSRSAGGQDSYVAAAWRSRLPGALTLRRMHWWTLHMGPAGKPETRETWILASHQKRVRPRNGSLALSISYTQCDCNLVCLPVCAFVLCYPRSDL